MFYVLYWTFLYYVCILYLFQFSLLLQYEINVNHPFSKSSCGYSTVEFTLKSSATSKTHPTYESIRSCKQVTQLPQRDRVTCIVSLNLVKCC